MRIINTMIPLAIFDQAIFLSTPTPSWLLQYLRALAVPHIVEEYELMVKFLLMYEGSSDTFTSYRREVERFCQWAWLVYQTPIKRIDRHGLVQYFHFIQHPPKDWIASRHAERFIRNEHDQRRPNPAWRPFLQRASTKNPKAKAAYSFSKSQIRASMASVSTCMSYLQQEGYIDKNPALLIRQKSRFIQQQQTQRITRKLTDTQWMVLVDALSEKAKMDASFERHVFLFAAFFLLGLRISELAETEHRLPKMGDFYKDASGRWWFMTVGKGNKYREVAVPDQMLQHLMRYRKYLGMSALPPVSDPRPLMVKYKGVGGLGVRQIRKVVQEGFDLAIASLQAADKADEAHAMRYATVHWLRHTAISMDVTHRPREHVRDDAGHQSITTTDRYIDIELDARHASAKQKKLVPKIHTVDNE